jgi:cbb3-type cytochrome oxidase subunit 3
MFTLLGVLGTQEWIIIFIALIKVGLLFILPVVIAYRLGKKKGKQEALEMQKK